MFSEINSALQLFVLVETSPFQYDTEDLTVLVKLTVSKQFGRSEGLDECFYLVESESLLLYIL